ncbi:MAG: hypothetical protein EXQ49_12655 [Acidobacteria bacterium]|nr:hypothetical protein [Acidobacteriota bacterium]
MGDTAVNGCALGDRARAPRRRRAQPDPRRTQLRLAPRDVRHQLRRHEGQRLDVAARSRAAARLLGASIGPSGLVFYSGNKFPAWRGNAFVGGMTMGRSRGTGQLQRLWFNQTGQVILREPLLVDLHQRIRSVYQGPDDLLYVLTEENNGAILKIEPAP